MAQQEREAAAVVEEAERRVRALEGRREELVGAVAGLEKEAAVRREEAEESVRERERVGGEVAAARRRLAEAEAGRAAAAAEGEGLARRAREAARVLREAEARREAVGAELQRAARQAEALRGEVDADKRAFEAYVEEAKGGLARLRTETLEGLARKERAVEAGAARVKEEEAAVRRARAALEEVGGFGSGLGVGWLVDMDRGGSNARCCLFVFSTHNAHHHVDADTGARRRGPRQGCLGGRAARVGGGAGRATAGGGAGAGGVGRAAAGGGEGATGGGGWW